MTIDQLGAKFAYNYAYGGSDYGSAATALSATVTVNGTMVSINNASYYVSEIFGYQTGSYGDQYHIVGNYCCSPSQEYSQAEIYGNDPTIPSSVTGPFTFTVGPNDVNYAKYYLANDTQVTEIDAEHPKAHCLISRT